MIRKLSLPEHLINYKAPWGPIGEQVYKRSYSHDLDDGSKETWPHTVFRAVGGNTGLVSPRFIEDGEVEKLQNLLLPFAALPAGRHLYSSGLIGRQFLNNCHAAGWDYDDPSAHFSFLFDELMQGGGVGSNYSNRYLEQMPKVLGSVDLHIVCDSSHANLNEFAHLLSNHVSTANRSIIHVLAEDSREGWVDILEQMVRIAYTNALETVLVVDVSPIRERGRKLETSGGIACGPGPLVSMLCDVVKLLNGCVGRRMTSLEAMTIDHTIASCVIAGGKRRSSRMSVKNWRDHDIFEFINCKREDGSHWTTNISVEVDDAFFSAYNASEDDITSSPGIALSHLQARTVMRSVVLGKRNNGEPGIWNISLAREGERYPDRVFCPNPCGEIALYMWENCNLGHINLGYFANKRPEEMYEAFRLMARWLVRATNGDIPQKRQRKVVDENRRIGVGFFGFHEWLAMRGIKYSNCWKNDEVIAMLQTVKAIVIKAGTDYATEMGLPIPVKFTTLAPTGTLVLMPGTTSSGQCMMTPWGKRLVRYASDDAQLAIKRSEGYEVFVDPDAKNTDIVVYWYEDPLVAKVRNAGFDPAEVLEGQLDVSFWDCLQVQKMLQTYYADNAISFTINVLLERMPDEESMETMLMTVFPFLKGTTVFPEKSRRNSPIQPVTKEVFDAYQGRKEISQVEDECKGACPVR